MPGGERQSGPMHLSWNSPGSSSSNSPHEEKKDPAGKSVRKVSLKLTLCCTNCHETPSWTGGARAFKGKAQLSQKVLAHTYRNVETQYLNMLMSCLLDLRQDWQTILQHNVPHTGTKQEG